MARCAIALLLLTLGTLISPSFAAVNKDLVAKKNERQKVKDKYIEDHPTVFDNFGRVMRWGKTPTSIDCVKKVAPQTGWRCKVAKSDTRKYRSKEEQRMQATIKVDMQAEMDRMGGGDSKDDERKRRQAKENRKRCNLYKEWEPKFAEDQDEKKFGFFQFLESEFIDFGKLKELTGAPGNKRLLRKAKKLYRNIMKQVHPDKLSCGSEGIAAMMKVVLVRADSMQKCVADAKNCGDDSGGFGGGGGGEPGGGGFPGGGDFNFG